MLHSFYSYFVDYFRISTDLERLTPAQLEWCYRTTLFPENRNNLILAQLYFYYGEGNEFRIYITENREPHNAKPIRTIIFSPVHVAKCDDQAANCGLFEALNFYRKNLKLCQADQLLIPIAEIGGYPGLSSKSRHFVLLHISLNEAGDLQQSTILDSNPYWHLRYNREGDIQTIMSKFIDTSLHQRLYLGLQKIGDNFSCGYFVLSFMKNIISQNLLQMSFVDYLLFHLGKKYSNTIFDPCIYQDFEQIARELDSNKGNITFNLSMGVMRSSTFSLVTSGNQDFNSFQVCEAENMHLFEKLKESDFFSSMRYEQQSSTSTPYTIKFDSTVNAEKDSPFPSNTDPFDMDDWMAPDEQADRNNISPVP